MRMFIAFVFLFVYGSALPAQIRIPGPTSRVDTAVKQEPRAEPVTAAPAAEEPVKQQVREAKKVVVDERGLAFIKRATTREAYARALERNDRSLLNVSCTDIVGAVAKIGVPVRTCTELAAYVRTLEVKPCPVLNRKVRLARVVRGAVDEGWQRELKRGELCLFDNNQAKWMFSLSCGNLILEELSVATAMVREERVSFVPATPVIRERADPLVTMPIENRSWWSRNKRWVIPTAIVVGGTAGGLCLSGRLGCSSSQKTDVTVIVTR